MTVAAVILAADAGDGFRTPKYLSDIDGRSMLSVVVESAVAWDVDDRFVVVGSDGDTTADSIADAAVTTLLDPEWSEGTASPIRAAIDLVSRDRSVTNIVFAKGDQPDVSARVVNALIAAAEETGADAVFPKYRYARGWPVVVGANLFPRLLGSEGDVDLPAFLSTHASTIEERWFDRLAPRSITSPDDLPDRRR